MAEMKKKYGLVTAVCMVVGIVVGSGIFFQTEQKDHSLHHKRIMSGFFLRRFQKAVPERSGRALLLLTISIYICLKQQQQRHRFFVNTFCNSLKLGTLYNKKIVNNYDSNSWCICEQINCYQLIKDLLTTFQHPYAHPFPVPLIRSSLLI